MLRQQLLCYLTTRKMSKKLKTSKATTIKVQSNELNKHASNSTAVHTDKAGNVCIRVFAKPGAKQNCITEVGAEGVSIQVASPPIDGEANSELIKYLSQILKLHKSDIQIQKGMRSRIKVLLVNKGITTPETILELMHKETAK